MNILISIALFLWSCVLCAESVGVVLFSTPHVTLRRGGADQNLNRGASLSAGDSIIAGANAGAQIRYLNGTLVSIGPDSEYTILSYNPKQTDVITAKLSKGKIESKTTGGPTHEKLETPVVALAITGTIYKVYVHKKSTPATKSQKSAQRPSQKPGSTSYVALNSTLINNLAKDAIPPKIEEKLAQQQFRKTSLAAAEDSTPLNLPSVNSTDSPPTNLSSGSSPTRLSPSSGTISSESKTVAYFALLAGKANVRGQNGTSTEITPGAPIQVTIGTDNKPVVTQAPFPPSGDIPLNVSNQLPQDTSGTGSSSSGAAQGTSTGTSSAVEAVTVSTTSSTGAAGSSAAAATVPVITFSISCNPSN